MFEQSLYVHSTVVSVDEASGKRVLDAGAKAVDLVRAAWRSVTEEEQPGAVPVHHSTC